MSTGEVCQCGHVPTSDVVALAREGVTSWLEVCRRLPVARGCGSCVPKVMAVLDAHHLVDPK